MLPFAILVLGLAHADASLRPADIDLTALTAAASDAGRAQKLRDTLEVSAERARVDVEGLRLSKRVTVHVVAAQRDRARAARWMLRGAQEDERVQRILRDLEGESATRAARQDAEVASRQAMVDLVSARDQRAAVLARLTHARAVLSVEKVRLDELAARTDPAASAGRVVHLSSRRTALELREAAAWADVQRMDIRQEDARTDKP